MKKINCKNCGSDISETLIPKYQVPRFGIPLVLIVSVKLAECPKCGKQEYSLPDICDLIATAAVSRVIAPKQLSAIEIRFIRKALGLTAVEFARILGTTLETISRWENEKLTNMSTSTEKLIRLLALNRLASEDFDINANSDRIINMDIERHNGKPTPMEQEIKLTSASITHVKRKLSWNKRGQKTATTNRARGELCLVR